MSNTPPDRLSPMDKWVTIIDAYLVSDEWGVRELARRIGLPRSAVHRLLHEMARLGILTVAQEPGRFQVGPVLMRIATVLYNRFDLARVARPIMEEMLNRCGETVVLTLYNPGRHQFCAIDAAEAKHAVRYMWEALREWHHLHLGSSGKGILAFLPLAEQQAILDQLPDPVLGATMLSKADLRHQLDQARSQGYILTRGERYAGAMGVAAPIYSALGKVIGDLIITAPETRAEVRPDAEWGALVKEAADRISDAIGYRKGKGAAPEGV